MLLLGICFNVMGEYCGKADFYFIKVCIFLSRILTETRSTVSQKAMKLKSLFSSFSVYFYCSTATEVLKVLPSKEEPLVSRVGFQKGSSSYVIWGLGQTVGFSPQSAKPLLSLSERSSEGSGDWNVASGLFSTNQTVNELDIHYWNLYSIDTFDADVNNLWSSKETSSCGESINLFLGGPCKTSDEVVIREFSYLPTHKSLRVTANVHFFDNWEGETFWMKIDDRFVWARQHFWCRQVFKENCRRLGIDSCGLKEFPDT
eukprot:GHVP01015667.1.p1 GENE.GHVP01015667.1~~GHVP01015667.1.p1  ORF type:complete len:259 (-),score=27.44 GHVP01015667.1:222-998(-)